MIKKMLNLRFSFCFLLFTLLFSSTTFAQILDFNPKTISAGTGSILTFTGIGFGSSRGPQAYVAFSRQDPTDLTKIKVLESDYILWTDTKIQVKVPAGAGTGGPIIVLDQIHAIYLSTLTISNVVNNGPTYISSFSPTTISAGTQNLLTINGSGFGAGPGRVLVKWSGRDGDTEIGISRSDIISWSNTQILIRVSESVGSGKIAVVTDNNPNTPIYSSTPLNVKYAVITSYSALPLILTNNNGTGGYTFRMETDFAANTAASASFKRAFDAWVCSTNVNWKIGPTTTVGEASSSNVNMVKFGGASEIITGTLAYTSMGFKKCANGEWELSDVDITFNDQDYNWNYGSNAPSSNQYDFETVALHQLGHAHGLVHVNNVDDIMYHTTGIGTVNRSLSSAAIEGGSFMLTNSTVMSSLTCNGAMVPFPSGSCGLPTPTITSFTPTTGSTGTVITITGTDFTGAMRVSFGNIPASSFTIVSPTTITAIVGDDGATGNINVATPGGLASATGFTFIHKLPQTLNYNTLPVKTYGDIDFDPNVTASTGLPIIYTSNNPLVATIVNNKVHIVGAGTAIITATQAGNNVYGKAAVNLNFSVNKANQNIDFSTIPAKLISDPDFELHAAASSGLEISFTNSNPNVISLMGNKAHIVGAGSTTITAIQNGNNNYNTAIPVAINLIISKFSQSVTFPAIGVKELNSPDFEPGASASSGLDITYSSSNPNVATIVNNKIHIVGAGSTTITASQAGNTEFASASKDVMLVVNKANQAITFTQLVAKYYNDADFDLTAIASSGLPVTYHSSNPAVATVTGNRVHIVASGTSVITASQAGSNNYHAAPQIAQSLDVIYSLPISNFTVKASDATCKASDNGTIHVTATQVLNYTATITGNNKTTTHPFNSILTLNNLAAGTYNVCITIAGQASYKQCFDLAIKEPKDLAVYSSLKDDGNIVVLKLEGSNLYHIEHNGQLFTTTNQEFTLPLIKGNNIVKISSDKICQGIIEKTFITTNTIAIYPNPIKDILYISTGSAVSNQVKLDIHALDGRLVHTSVHVATYDRISTDLSKLTRGLYVLTLSIGNQKTIHKIIKE